MRICDNGATRDMTPEEEAEYLRDVEKMKRERLKNIDIYTKLDVLEGALLEVIVNG